MGTVVKHTETRELRCDLTQDEVSKRAERIAELHERLETLEAGFGAVRARHKAALEEAKAELAGQLDEFRTRSELRQVLCDLRLDYETRRAELVRTDTGEMVYERALRDDERQAALPFDHGDPGDEVHSRREHNTKAETERAGVV